jgi:hypothetical protein
MSRKIYNFIPLTIIHNDRFDLEHRPYSGCVSNSLNKAYSWAEMLLKFNADFIGLQFKAENGKKVYTFYRLTEQTISLFTQSYIATLFWSEGEKFDEASFSDLSDKAYEQIKKDCKNFAEKCKVYFTLDNWDEMGHDFALTRNHQGAGFSDGDWPRNGEKLIKIAESFKEQHLYYGDDKKIYVA